MTERVEPSQISYEKLSDGHLEIIKTFQNQEKDLVDFLQEDALENQRRGVSVTYLFLSKKTNQN